MKEEDTPMRAFSGGLYFIGERLALDRRATSSLFMYFPLDFTCCVLIFNQQTLFYGWCTVGASLLIVLLSPVLLTLFGMQKFTLNYIL